MFEICVYGKNRDIPWPQKKTHIYLIAGSPKRTENEEMVEHLRKFHLPEENRAISIKEVDVKPKSVRGMTLLELRDLAELVA